MLNVFGPLNKLGMGVHCYNLVKAYEKLHNKSGPTSSQQLAGGIAVFPPFGRDNINDLWTQRWLGNRAHADVRKDISLMIFDTAFFMHFAGRKRVGFVVFETTGFTQLQMAAIRSLDHVIVPSEWARSILHEHNIESFVVNEGFDPDEFPMSILMEPEKEDRPFRFVHVGKLEERKGTLQAVRCFANEFKTEAVELLLHCDNPFIEDGGRSQVSKALNDDGFKTSGWRAQGLPNKWTRGAQNVYWDEPREKMSPLYVAADCGIFPSRGEGWGLPILECIASGTPVICGNWTGMSEYISHDKYPERLIIRHASLELAQDGAWFHGDRGDWFVPPDHEVEKSMRWAFQNGRMLIRTPEWIKAVIEMRHLTWERAAKQLDEVIKKISSES